MRGRSDWAAGLETATTTTIAANDVPDVEVTHPRVAGGLRRRVAAGWGTGLPA